MTGGRFTIVPRASGELAPGLEVLNVVEQGAVPIGHTASYYYTGKSRYSIRHSTTLRLNITATKRMAIRRWRA